MPRLLTVDLEASFVCKGEVIAIVKEFEIPEDVIERGKTDRDYRQQVILQLVSKDIIPGILSQRTFCCGISHKHPFRKFTSIPSGFTLADEQGRIPCKILLFPTCGSEKCEQKTLMKFNQGLKLSAKKTGNLQFHPNRGVQTCAKCRKSDDDSESFKRCSRCRVAYYCSPECQHEHWKVHKKVCKAP